MRMPLETISPEHDNDFAVILQIIEQNRSKAIQAVNHASLLTAWEVGAFVSDKIKTAKWGAKVVQQLAEYIHTQDPTLKGWSKVTIYRMVQFYDTYSSQEFLNLLQHFKLSKPIESATSEQLASKPIVSAQMTQLPEVVRYALNRSMSPTMVSRYEEQIKVGSVLQRSLEEFVEFLN